MKKQKTSKKVLTILGLFFLGIIFSVSAYTLYEDLNMDGNEIYNVTAVMSEGEGWTADIVTIEDEFTTETSEVTFEQGYTTGGNIMCVGSGVIEICPNNFASSIKSEQYIGMSPDFTEWTCGPNNNGEWVCRTR